MLIYQTGKFGYDQKTLDVIFSEKCELLIAFHFTLFSLNEANELLNKY